MGSVTHQRLTALLNVHSFFSFGAGVASPTRLLEVASSKGYTHLALTDYHGVYGAAELFACARTRQVTPLIGATIWLELTSQRYPVVLLASSLQRYATLNRLLSLIHASEAKVVTLSVLEAHSHELHLLTGGRQGFAAQLIKGRRVHEAERHLHDLKGIFGTRCWVQLSYGHYKGDLKQARLLRELAHSVGLAAVLAPEVRHLTPEQFPLYDALVCARLGISVDTPHPERSDSGGEVCA